MTEFSACEGTPYAVVTPAADSPVFPAGFGGLTIDVSAGSGPASTAGAVVTVDGAPAVQGRGTALIVLPPGEHIVEFWQWGEIRRSSRITVRPNETVTRRFTNLDVLTPPRATSGHRRLVVLSQAWLRRYALFGAVGIAFVSVAEPVLESVLRTPQSVVVPTLLAGWLGLGIGVPALLRARRRRMWRETQA